MRRLDLIIAAVVILLVAFAVVRQLTGGGEDPATGPRTVGIGEALSPDITLTSLDGERVRLGDALGTKGTILYAWSTTCPCIPFCEDKMRELHARFGPGKGYTWFAIAGEPTETAEGIRQEMTSLRAFYPMLLDPSHRLCARVGFDRAAMVAILDPDGYLRFRGNLGDDLRNPTKIWLEGALEAIDAGLEPNPAETDIAYGCVFSVPIDCEDDVLPEPTPAAPSAP